jgi:chlorobactene glucosyltransferase
MALVLLTAFILLYISLVAILNALTFPRLKSGSGPWAADDPDWEGPFVSVLVPARNEVRNIARLVGGILSQDGVDFELLVLDDQSVDGTADQARKSAGRDSRLRVLQGEALPEGWGGKNWACHQLSQAAQGEILVFTDADTLWQPGALRGLVAYLLRERAELVTVWPTQITGTWGERLTVPLIALVVMGYLPLLAVHYIPWPIFSAANGQCLAFRRAAYQKIGGHAALRRAVVEDIRFAWRIKSAGLRLRMMDGAGLLACRMYSSWQEARDGLAKSLMAGYGNSLFFLGMATFFHWLVFGGPWLWLALGWLKPTWPVPVGVLAAPAWPGWPLGLIFMGLGARALSAVSTRQRVADALLMPISVVLMTLITARAVDWHVRLGGPVWKGRTISR